MPPADKPHKGQCDRWCSSALPGLTASPDGSTATRRGPWAEHTSTQLLLPCQLATAWDKLGAQTSPNTAIQAAQLQACQRVRVTVRLRSVS